MAAFDLMCCQGNLKHWTAAEQVLQAPLYRYRNPKMSKTFKGFCRFYYEYKNDCFEVLHNKILSDLFEFFLYYLILLFVNFL